MVATPAAEDAAGGGEEPTAEREVGEGEMTPTKLAGANRFVWNLRGRDATKLPDNKGRGGTAEMLGAPRMPPGRYQVRLTVDGGSVTQPFVVLKDPRVATTDADLSEQYALARRTHDLLTKMHDAVLALRDVRAQAQAWAERTDKAAIRDAARALARSLGAVESELVQLRSDDPRMFPSKLNTRVATLVSLIEYSDAAPTAAFRELHDDLAQRAAAELAKVDRCLAEDVPAFNALCRGEGMAAILPKRAS